MKNEQKQGIKLTGILINAIIIGSLVLALTSGYRLV